MCYTERVAVIELVSVRTEASPQDYKTNVKKRKEDDMKAKI